MFDSFTNSFQPKHTRTEGRNRLRGFEPLEDRAVPALLNLGAVVQTALAPPAVAVHVGVASQPAPCTPDLLGVNLLDVHGGLKLNLPTTADAVLAGVTVTVESSLSIAASLGINTTALANSLAAQVSGVLHDVGCDFGSVANLLADSCHQSPGQVCGCLSAAGYATADIAAALKVDLGCTVADVTAALQGVGCKATEIAGALKAGIGCTAVDVVTALNGIGCKTADITVALKVCFNLTAGQVGSCLQSASCR